MRDEGADNNLLQQLADDERIPLDAAEIERLTDVREFVGRAPEQVTEFLGTELTPVLDTARNEGLLGQSSEVKV